MLQALQAPIFRHSEVDTDRANRPLRALWRRTDIFEKACERKVGAVRCKEVPQKHGQCVKQPVHHVRCFCRVGELDTPLSVSGTFWHVGTSDRRDDVSVDPLFVFVRGVGR